MSNPVPAQNMFVVSDSFSRPDNTTAYASGDLIANSATAGSVAPLIFTLPRKGFGNGYVEQAKLFKDDDDVTNPDFRLHLFTGDPTATAPANGDNGALALNTSITDYVGSFVFDGTTVDIYNTAGNLAVAAPVVGDRAFFKLPSGAGASSALYGLLEARGAYTPASEETFTLQIEGKVW